MAKAKSFGSNYTPEQRDRVRELIDELRAERLGVVPTAYGPVPRGLVSGAAMRLEAQARGLPTTPAGRLAYETELRQMLAAAEPRSLWQRARDAWAGMVAGWRGGQ